MYTKFQVRLPSLAPVRANTPGTAGTSSVASTSQEKPGNRSSFDGFQPDCAFSIPVSAGESFGMVGEPQARVNAGFSGNIESIRRTLTRILISANEVVETPYMQGCFNSLLEEIAFQPDSINLIDDFSSRLAAIVDWANSSQRINETKRKMLLPLIEVVKGNRGVGSFLVALSAVEDLLKLEQETTRQVEELQRNAEKMEAIYQFVINDSESRAYGFEGRLMEFAAEILEEKCEAGDVLVRLGALNSKLEAILVWATSPGVSVDMKKEVFEPFFNDPISPGLDAFMAKLEFVQKAGRKIQEKQEKQELKVRLQEVTSLYKVLGKTIDFFPSDFFQDLIARIDGENTGIEGQLVDLRNINSKLRAILVWAASPGVSVDMKKEVFEPFFNDPISPGLGDFLEQLDKLVVSIEMKPLEDVVGSLSYFVRNFDESQFTAKGFKDRIAALLKDEIHDPAARQTSLEKFNLKFGELISLCKRINDVDFAKQDRKKLVVPLILDIVVKSEIKSLDSFSEKLDLLLSRLKIYDPVHKDVNKALENLAFEEADLIVNLLFENNSTDADSNRRKRMRLYVYRKLADCLCFEKGTRFFEKGERPEEYNLKNEEKIESYARLKAELGKVMTEISNGIGEFFSPARVLDEVRKVYLEKVDELKLKYFINAGALFDKMSPEAKQEQKRKFINALTEDVLKPMGRLLGKTIEIGTVVDVEDPDAVSVKSELSRLFKETDLWKKAYLADERLGKIIFPLQQRGCIAYDSSTGNFVFVARNSRKVPKQYPLEVKHVREIDFTKVSNGHFYPLLRQLVVEGKLARSVLIDYLKDRSSIEWLQGLKEVKAEAAPVPCAARSGARNPFLEAVENLKNVLPELELDDIESGIFRYLVTYGFDKGFADGSFPVDKKVVERYNKISRLPKFFQVTMSSRTKNSDASGTESEIGRKRELKSHLLKKFKDRGADRLLSQPATDSFPVASRERKIMEAFDKLSEAMVEAVLDLLSWEDILLTLKSRSNDKVAFKFYLGKLLNNLPLSEVMELVKIENRMVETSKLNNKKGQVKIARHSPLMIDGYLKEALFEVFQTKQVDVDGELVRLISSGKVPLQFLKPFIDAIRSRGEVTQIADLVRKTIGLPSISSEIRGYLLNLPEWTAAAGRREMEMEVEEAGSSRPIAAPGAPGVRERSPLRRSAELEGYPEESNA